MYIHMYNYILNNNLDVTNFFCSLILTLFTVSTCVIFLMLNRLVVVKTWRNKCVMAPYNMLCTPGSLHTL